MPTVKFFKLDGIMAAMKIPLTDEITQNAFRNLFEQFENLEKILNRLEGRIEQLERKG